MVSFILFNIYNFRPPALPSLPLKKKKSRKRIGTVKRPTIFIVKVGEITSFISSILIVAPSEQEKSWTISSSLSGVV
jgi:hypothetical protein